MSDCCSPGGGLSGDADPGHVHDPSCAHHGTGIPEPGADDTRARIALIGSPNAGKTSIFNALTGLRLKTGNYPGVTVTRSVGRVRIRAAEPASALVTAGPAAAPVKKKHQHAYLEDLPGTYSLTPISPDEQVVADLLTDGLKGVRRPDAALVVVDATVLERSLALVAETLNLGIPVAVALSMCDEMERRNGHVDPAALEEALGVPVRAVIGTKPSTLEPVRRLLADPAAWPRPVVPPPAEPGRERADWIASALAESGYRTPREHSITTAVDRLLLHPAWGTLVFLAVMFAFFQVIFTLAAPLQDYIETFFGWLGTLVTDHVSQPLLADFLGTALIGGVGGVLVFVPQIMLMFLLISLLENVGYMSRAAFLTDRVMSRAGLEGRAFVAMLSSFACAVPGIMATRTIPSSRDRIATTITAPLMTCSARIPVFVLLIGMLISKDARFGPFNAQGTAMFGLYLLGGLSAMIAAAIFKRTKSLRSDLMPFYMEMPPYRLPGIRTVLLTMWDSSKQFLQKVGKIILATSIVLWILMSLPAHTEQADAARDTATAAALAHGATPDAAAAQGEAAARSFVLDHSIAASIGKAVEPVFRPLGFDWRIDIGILGSFAAREVVVSTLGQIAAAEDPENPADALKSMRYTHGPNKGEIVFSPPTVVAMLLFFVYALQCMSTLGAIRRETNSWKWPAISWTYMFVLAWVAAYLGHTITAAVTG
ncbi:ferrous iron transporter B [Gordonia sp. PP30]|uniref:ferrous iron transporter B n=1 Tax=Gordonia sp. PP30 TaxID=2935861 RepID=UPI0020004EF5|nr:ferrous iron transporter B [Gordonia sp. PP30]UQE75287.1 ferrous iron transporter B [Gordonia sp. PP30]